MVQIPGASKIASRDDLRNMLIDYLVSGGSLESLEEKNDSHLSAWLTRKWQSRCSLSTLSPDSGRRVDSLPPTGRESISQVHIKSKDLFHAVITSDLIVGGIFSFCRQTVGKWCCRCRSVRKGTSDQVMVQHPAAPDHPLLCCKSSQ